MWTAIRLCRHRTRSMLIWRFCIACEPLAVHVAAGLSPLPAAGMGQRTRHVTAARGALRRGMTGWPMVGLPASSQEDPWLSRSRESRPSTGAARNRLLDQEIELRRAMEAVAEARRRLPPGGVVTEDYVFQAHGPDSAPARVRLSELFAPG